MQSPVKYSCIRLIIIFADYECLIHLPNLFACGIYTGVTFYEILPTGRVQLEEVNIRNFHYINVCQFYMISRRNTSYNIKQNSLWRKIGTTIYKGIAFLTSSL
jgi:hypothetical protein